MGKSMYELRDKLCDELDEVARKPEMGAGDLELAHKLTDTIKNIDKICIMDETGGYSQAGDWEARGHFGDQYARDGYNEGGNSYRGRNRDNMGRYSRDDGMYDDGMSQRRGMSRRGYSRGGMMEHVDAMMDEAETEEQREEIRRFKKKMETMR